MRAKLSFFIVGTQYMSNTRREKIRNVSISFRIMNVKKKQLKVIAAEEQRTVVFSL